MNTIYQSSYYAASAIENFVQFPNSIAVSRMKVHSLSRMRMERMSVLHIPDAELHLLGLFQKGANGRTSVFAAAAFSSFNSSLVITRNRSLA